MLCKTLYIVIFAKALSRSVWSNLSKEGVFEIRARLDEELAEKFKKIRKRYHLRTNADTVRLCISLQYERVP